MPEPAAAPRSGPLSARDLDGDAPTRRRDRNRSDGYPPARLVDFVIAAAGFLAALLVAFDVPGDLRAFFTFAVWVTVPGWALLRFVTGLRPSARVALTLSVSVVIATIVALTMVWTTLWFPRAVGVAILVVASASLLVWRAPGSAPSDGKGSARGRPVARIVTIASLVVLAGAVVAWIFGLAQTGTGDLGEWGLLPEFSIWWYVGVGITLLLCLVGIARAPASKIAVALPLTALIVQLFATADLLAPAPRLPWVYKHIAVTNYITSAGSVDPWIDIYNRFPGFFSSSALLGEVMGQRDAVSYAGYAGVASALLDAVLVYAIARTVSRHAAVAWTAALGFTVANWVGQNYYSPQTFGFALYLALVLVALTFLRGEPFRWVRRIETMIALPRYRSAGDRHTDHLAFEGASNALPEIAGRSKSYPRATRWAAIGAVLALQAVIVVSHQLTPYIAILTILPLSVIGYLRPRWLGLGMTALALLYLVPNLDYVQDQFGLFSGFDVFGNATYTPEAAVQTTEAEMAQSTLVKLLSVLVIGLGGLGFLRKAMQGGGREALIVLWLSAAPALTLLGQSYGGEGRFRIYLFALAFFAIGLGWLFWSGIKARWVAIVASSIAMLAIASLFVGAYFQPEAKLRVTAYDLEASQWLDAQLEEGDTVMLAPAPLLVGENYPLLLEYPEQTYNLQYFIGYAETDVAVEDVEYIIDTQQLPGATYLMFSDSMQKFGTVQVGIEPKVLEVLEPRLARSPDFEEVYNSGDVRIYRYEN